MYAIKNGLKITIHDGWGKPSVTIRCDSEEWVERMSALVQRMIEEQADSGKDVWAVR